MAQIVIVDDHQLLAEALRIALREVGLDTVYVAPTERTELLATVLNHHPEAVLLDLNLGEYGDSTSLIPPLVAAGVRVLVVTGMADRLRIAEALECGALGYYLKSEDFEQLVQAVQRLRTCQAPLDPRTRTELLEALRVSRAERKRAFGPFQLLTEREQDTLRALSRGHSVHEIASEWVVSEATVRTHVRGVLTKLDAPSQLAAVANAIRTGWLTAEGRSLTSMR